MKHLPIALIFLRLFLGISVLLLSIIAPADFQLLIICLIIIGFVTDILDGIIARRLNISTLVLRRWDSAVDQVFWVCAFITAYLISPDFFKNNISKFVIVLALEAATYLVCFLRFKKEVATHSILSKFWVISMLAVLLQVIYSGGSHSSLYICFYLGIISRLEIIAILIILRNWTSDVPTAYHALQLRKGKEIKRHKLFNG